MLQVYRPIGPRSRPLAKVKGERGLKPADPEVKLIHATMLGLAVYNFFHDDADSARVIDSYISQLPKLRRS